MPIIQSLLETDSYKFSMMKCVYHQFPATTAEMKFHCRNDARTNALLASYVKEIRSEISQLGSLSFTAEELTYLHSLRYLSGDFVDFLKYFRLDPDRYVKIEVEDEKLSIRIKGPWIQIILFEIFILAIVNEVYFKHMAEWDNEIDWHPFGKYKLFEKMRAVKEFAKEFPDFKFAEFGTRRRFSREWHESILPIMIESGHLAGTSNVRLSMKYGITPIGTQAHEFLQAGQAMEVRLVNSQKYMLDAWVREYRGDLGIALTDTIGIDSFLKDFDLFFAKLYDGVRHDSGDPFSFGEKVIDHYKKLRIDPKTKMIVFSDSLNFEKAFDLYRAFSSRIKVSIAIGTNLTNDVGFEPLNIVIKMVRCNGQPVAKISDSPSKGMCEDQQYVDYLKSVFGRV